MTQKDEMDEARAVIMDGDSKPIRTINPRAREHLVTLRNGKTIRVIYDRTIGEVTEILPDIVPGRLHWQ